ncbi:DUF5615 family PIN-like protein [cf. Phormidesmis sp. LEGE 11477]|uniref:DUF5615 family PIN-like protein n=1 Tax=cf. Phormidesmis sp. LEGE 11477 TaxID=1828680 RepID=UPI00187F8476|nr:DUF5615 family PIN-like protein [cf. Phormidesmis sp. LEGE 11477]MBE9064293.1 DUF5615 family PIN-like protein [cf. Phormidesmis sp. LEGE 11477]
MLFLTDENFNGAILRGLIRRLPNLDIVRVQDVGLLHAADPVILEWAANEGRILLTHDVATVVSYAYQRVKQNLVMPGVVAVIATASIGRVLDDLELLIFYGEIDDYENGVTFVPL